MQHERVPPPHTPSHDILEPLERLEALLVIMLSSDLGCIAPASRYSAIALAHSLAASALETAKKSHPC